MSGGGGGVAAGVDGVAGEGVVDLASEGGAARVLGLGGGRVTTGGHAGGAAGVVLDELWGKLGAADPLEEVGSAYFKSPSRWWPSHWKMPYFFAFSTRTLPSPSSV